MTKIGKFSLQKYCRLENPPPKTANRIEIPQNPPLLQLFFHSPATKIIIYKKKTVYHIDMTKIGKFSLQKYSRPAKSALKTAYSTEIPQNWPKTARSAENFWTFFAIYTIY